MNGSEHTSCFSMHPHRACKYRGISAILGAPTPIIIPFELRVTFANS